MEPRSKLQATPSCQVQGAAGERIMIDRFSDLPDEIAHHILNFLGESLRSLIRLGAVSKRCRQLHLSAPSLTISSRDSTVFECSRLRAKLLNHWDRYLFSRLDNKIKDFGIFWSFDARDGPMISDDEFFRITTLIQNALRCNVELLHLDFTPVFYFNIAGYKGYTAMLLSCIFHSQSLKQLTVHLSGGGIQSPSLSFSSYLQCLELHNAKVEDDRFFKWISQSCKCMKELHLLNVVGIKSITIESSSLEKLNFLLFSDICELHDLKISGQKLEDVCLLWHFHSSGGSILGGVPFIRSLSIFAPILKKLSWNGNFLNHQHLGSLKCLEYASICLFPVVEKSSNFFEVLSSLCMVRTLFLNEQTTKAFFFEGSLPLPLCNIRDLHLRVRSLEDDFIPALVYIFRGITTLNTLRISSRESETDTNHNSDSTEEDDATEGEDFEADTENGDTTEEDDASEEENNESDVELTDNSETTEEDDATEEENNAPKFDLEYWKSQNLTFTNELEEVKLEIVEGNDNGMELARYILEHAQNLKKMVIHHSPQHPDVVDMARRPAQAR